MAKLCRNSLSVEPPIQTERHTVLQKRVGALVKGSLLHETLTSF